jgi:tetratricopeptide (TPR) repeat protein
MTPKFGGGSQKPAFVKKDKPGGDADKGIRRKDGPPSKVPSGVKDDHKPLFGDVAEDKLDEALAAVDRELAAQPAERELHEKKYRILRKLNDRPAMRAALQHAAREASSGNIFFGVKLAEALEEEGAYVKALEWRRWVAQSEPNESDTIRRLAATAVRAGNIELAESSYSHLIELKKNDESPLGGTFYEEMLGKGLSGDERQSLQQMALRLLAQALGHQTHSPVLLESAARLAYRVRDLDASCRYYERAIATNGSHRNCRLWKVELLRAYAMSGLQRPWYDLSQAFIAELRSHLEQDRTDTRSWTILAQLQIQAGYFEDAIVTLKSALAADSKNAQALWELGRLYVRMGRSQEAIEYYLEIINDPNEKKSVRRAIERTLADLYFKTGQYQDALELFLRDPEANMRMIAPIYEAVGDLATAEEYYLKSVKQAPRDARTYLGVAEYWVRRENWEQAAASGREGLRCTYATEEVHSNLAVALATAQMNLKSIEDALATMEEICQAYPDSIHQTFRKAKLLIKMNRRADGMKLAEEVRTSATHQTGCAPASSSLWSLLGDCHTLLNDIESAWDAYTNALKYDFMDSVAVRGLGMIAEKQQESQTALDLYERFVVLDPLNLATPTVRNMIKKLKDKLGIVDAPAQVPPVAESEAAGGPPAGPPAAPNAPVSAPSQGSPPAKQEGWMGDGGLDYYQ